MGVFNEVAVHCPKCGHVYVEQVKPGEHRWYDIGEAPPHELARVADESPWTCEECGARFRVRLIPIVELC